VVQWPGCHDPQYLQRPPTTSLMVDRGRPAALRGILCRLWDLNLTLISVRRIEADGKEEHENG